MTPARLLALGFALTALITAAGRLPEHGRPTPVPAETPPSDVVAGSFGGVLEVRFRNDDAVEQDRVAAGLRTGRRRGEPLATGRPLVPAAGRRRRDRCVPAAGRSRAARPPAAVRTGTVVLLLALTACSRSTPVVDRIDASRLSGDGRTLTVTVTHGVCEEGTRRVTVEESAKQVRVRVDGARALDGACVGMGVRTELSAQLDRPLGDRVVVDDATGQPVELP